jgi:hypothetical protein
MSAFVTDEAAENALDFLMRSAAEIGKLTERALMAEKLEKITLAIEMKKSGESSAAAQEREARISEAFRSCATETAITAGELAMAKAKREAAIAKLDCYRTQQATQRAARL